MSEIEAFQQLRVVVESIKSIGESIEANSVKCDCEIQETLKSGRKMGEKLFNRSFDDSFNI